MSGTLDMNVPMCSTQENPWCDKRATTTFICKVEGREVRMCGPCNAAWKDKARHDPYLLARCPNCTKNRQPEALPRPVIVPSDVEMLGEYTEAAVRAAMERSGVLIDQRENVIRLLKTDLSVWVEVPVARAGAPDAPG